MIAVDQLEAVELRQMLDRRELTSVELTGRFLDIIRERNPGSNSFLSIENGRALAAARAADHRLAAGDSVSGMLGIPVAIKDVFERDGCDVTAGSKPWTFRARRTAGVVDRLTRAGAIILGTLHLDEFAAGGTGVNSHFGRCVNPIDPRYLTGGSSSGSAAAVGARMTPLAVGSDAGGSIRIPAAYCGVTGLKPTYGRVTRAGAVPRTWSMDCVGPLGKSAADCTLLLDAIAGLDPDDPTTTDAPAAFLSATDDGLRSQSVVMDPELLNDCCPDNVAAIDNVARMFRDLGHRVVDTGFSNIDLLNDMQQVIVKCEGATCLGNKLRDNPASISAETRAVIQEGFVLPATSYLEALSLRSALLERFISEVLGDAELLLLPVTPGLTPLYNTGKTSDSAEIDKQFTDSARFTRFANYLGLPAIVFPVGIAEDWMPVSVQLVGRPWSEKALLNCVHHIQTALK